MPRSVTGNLDSGGDGEGDPYGPFRIRHRRIVKPLWADGTAGATRWESPPKAGRYDAAGIFI